MSKQKILVIDDDKSIRNFYSEVFQSTGYEVVLASGGKEGLEILKGDEKIDLIILDLQMSEMDGFEVLAKLREIFEEFPPVVVSTGHGTIENAVKAIKIGASDFIVKPFNVADLLQKVNRNLKLKALSQEISELKMVQTIFEFNKDIISLIELDSLLDRIVNIIDDLFLPDRVAFYFANKKGENFILRKQKSKIDKSSSFLTSLSSDEISDIFNKKKVVIKKDSDFTEVMILIKGKEKNIGVIQCSYHGRERKLSPKEIKFLEAFADQAGIGIENAILFEMANDSYINAIRSLVKSLEAKDAYTKGHSEQVAYYGLLIGRALGLKEKQLEYIRNAGYLHDLGKLGIKDEILFKPGPLEKEEFEIVKKHPVITVQILKPLDVKKEEMEACLYHHERINGKGYPEGLKGDEIPLFARILAVSDAYSAMISERPYRKTMSKNEAMEELRKNVGTQFDKDIVDVFLNVLSREEP